MIAMRQLSTKDQNDTDICIHFLIISTQVIITRKNPF